MTSRDVVDANILHGWESPVEVFEYLSKGWRHYVADHMMRPWHDYFLGYSEKPEGRLTATPMGYDLAYNDPIGDFAPESMMPDAFAAGSNLAVVREQHLDPARVEHALLCHGSGMLVPALPAPTFTAELVRAINDWTVDRWLESDASLLGTILVPTQHPEVAAAEIRRVGGHERMSAVLLGANGLSKPFGHPVYHPIYEAAEELGLAVVIRAGGDQTAELPTYPAAAGLPSTHTEFRVLAAQVLMTHTTSLIAQGVLDRWRSLKFLLLGGGMTWIVPFLWRFDMAYRSASESVLWLKSFPSEVFLERFFVGSEPLQLGDALPQLASYMQVDHDLSDIICYASGYPERDYLGPDAVAEALPADWRSKVLRENALRFLPDRVLAANSTSLDPSGDRP